MRKIRISILMIVVTLILFGVVMVYSSSAIFCYDKYHSSIFFLKRHIFHLVLGLALTIFIMSLDLRLIRRAAKPLFIFSVVLLILCFVPHLGKEVGGAKRWLKLGIFTFQPSELTKWVNILFLADILSAKRKSSADFIGRLTIGLSAVGITAALILLQPDLGSALALSMVGMLMFFVAGMNLAYLIGLILLALPIFYLAIFKVPYRKKRIIAFLNPWADVRGIGFQLVQSYLALGLGGLFGVGLGQSRQKLFYLPAAHTDFIFSIVGEELGLLGTVSIVILFMLLLWQGMKISLSSQDTFIQLLSFGIVTTIVFSACVHIAVVCGAVPTKGLPLPFISYGGTALIFNMMAVGLLLNAARDRHFQEDKPPAVLDTATKV